MYRGRWDNSSRAVQKQQGGSFFIVPDRTGTTLCDKIRSSRTLGSIIRTDECQENCDNLYSGLGLP